jgi:hypothetical protein
MSVTSMGNIIAMIFLFICLHFHSKFLNILIKIKVMIVSNGATIKCKPIIFLNTIVVKDKAPEIQSSIRQKREATNIEKKQATIIAK